MTESITSDRYYFICDNNNCLDFLKYHLKTVEIVYKKNFDPNTPVECPTCKTRMRMTDKGPVNTLRGG